MVSDKQGILLINVGSPDAPTPKEVKRYLTQFLSDQRVVDYHRLLWLPLLHAVILPKRVNKVAQKYQSIWTENGSPLLAYSQQLQKSLAARLPKDLAVELAMAYGSISIKNALARLIQKGITKLIVLPMFPQYCSATTGAVWNALSSELSNYRSLPSIIFIRDYAEHPLYIEALCESIRDSFAEHGQPDKLIFSYHSLPKRYIEEGDPYAERCMGTTRAVVATLGLTEEQYQVTWQSRFGKEIWLMPSTSEILESLPKQDIKHVQVICPCFAVDCLETIEEINIDNRQRFISSGGEQFHYISSLNNRASHVHLLEALVRNI